MPTFRKATTITLDACPRCDSTLPTRPERRPCPRYALYLAPDGRRLCDRHRKDKRFSDLDPVSIKILPVTLVWRPRCDCPTYGEPCQRHNCVVAPDGRRLCYPHAAAEYDGRPTRCGGSRCQQCLDQRRNPTQRRFVSRCTPVP